MVNTDTTFRDQILREAAQTQRAAISEIVDTWDGISPQAMLDELIDLIDPDVPKQSEETVNV